MSYAKQTWSDRMVQYPMRFNMQENSDGTITLIPAPGNITENGTLVTASRMNYIEDGIQSCMQTNDITIVTGEITCTRSAGSSDERGSTTINYPTGFNKDNTKVLSLMAKLKDTDRGYSYGVLATSNYSAAVISGNIGQRVLLADEHISIAMYYDWGTTSTDSRTDIYEIQLILLKR